jgi:hypothetical protein
VASLVPTLRLRALTRTSPLRMTTAPNGCSPCGPSFGFLDGYRPEAIMIGFQFRAPLLAGPFEAARH